MSLDERLSQPPQSSALIEEIKEILPGGPKSKYIQSLLDVADTVDLGSQGEQKVWDNIEEEVLRLGH